MTATITEERTALEDRVITDREPEADIPTSTDKPESAHIVMVPSGEPDQTPQAYVMRAMVEGFAIMALCGYVFTPSRGAKNLPVCAPCKAVFENDPLGHGDRGELPDE